MKPRMIVEAIATSLEASRNCKARGIDDWEQRWGEYIDVLCADLPSGSGFDQGTTFDRHRSQPNRLIFETAFHHMEDGYYVGWTSHDVIVTPSFTSGFDIEVTGDDTNGILDYIGETFGYLLRDVAPSLEESGVC